jgi:hypothetical protein
VFCPSGNHGCTFALSRCARRRSIGLADIRM